jgi:hypothetical protein
VALTALRPLGRPYRDSTSIGASRSCWILAKAAAKDRLRDFPWLRVIDCAERFVLG